MVQKKKRVFDITMTRNETGNVHGTKMEMCLCAYHENG